MLDDLSVFEGLVSIRNYIALKLFEFLIVRAICLVSIRNYIALKPLSDPLCSNAEFSIHTKLHRSKT